MYSSQNALILRVLGSETYQTSKTNWHKWSKSQPKFWWWEEPSCNFWDNFREEIGPVWGLHVFRYVSGFKKRDTTLSTRQLISLKKGGCEGYCIIERTSQYCQAKHVLLTKNHHSWWKHIWHSSACGVNHESSFEDQVSMDRKRYVQLLIGIWCYVQLKNSFVLLLQCKI